MLATLTGKLVGAGLIVLALVGVFLYAHGVLAERDELRRANRTLTDQAKTQNDAIERARNDAIRQAKTADKLSADRDAHATRAATLLRDLRGVPIITASTAACAATAGTDTGRSAQAGECGLSAEDRSSLETRLMRTREQTFIVGAEADQIALRLTAAQAEAVRLFDGWNACIDMVSGKAERQR